MYISPCLQLQFLLNNDAPHTLSKQQSSSGGSTTFSSTAHGRVSHHIGTFLHESLASAALLEVNAKMALRETATAHTHAQALARTAARASAGAGVRAGAGAGAGVGAGAGSGGEFVPMDPECRRILNTFFMKCAFGPPVETEMDHR